MSESPTLLLPHEYVRDATKRIKKAKKRVAFISMVIADDKSTKNLTDALADAAKRGVEVYVSADMFTYTELSGQFIPAHYYSKKVRSTTLLSQKLDKAGVHFHWLGRMSLSLFSGRTHTKWCVVDDTVYSFGGVNLYEEGVENNDYMFRIYDQTLALRLITEHKDIVRADKGRFAYRSRSFTCDAGTVLIDGGFFGDSIIYRTACKLAEEATHITYVSQYCPTGKLSKLLKKTSSSLFFNSWQKATGFNKLIIKLGMKLSGQNTQYTRNHYLHAKFIIFTMPDGSQTAITGSHNFVHGGVMLGTREIALLTSDTVIISQLESFLKQHII